MKDTALLTSEAASSAAVSPVTASNPAGSVFATLSRSSAWDVPGSAVTQMSVNSSLPPTKSRCAVAVSNVARLAPTVPPLPNPTRPTRRAVTLGWVPEETRRTSSPIR